MDLVPESVGGAVVFNVVKSCGANRLMCGNCADFAVAVHNCLMSTEIRYVVLDLQDEKEVCGAFLEEVLQLAKRMRIPFLFAGVMDKPRRLLEAYDFTRKTPLFLTPEEAVAWLKANHPDLLAASKEGIEYGVPVASSRPRNAALVDAEVGEAEAVD